MFCAQICMLVTVIACFALVFEMMRHMRTEERELLERRKHALEEHDMEALAQIARLRSLRGRAGLSSTDVDGTTGWILVVMFALTMLLAVATVWRVFVRLRTASSDVRLKDVQAT